MSSVTSSLDPYLVAILLVCNTRSGSGAQIVYHYPSDPLPSNDVATNKGFTYGTYGDDDSNSFSDEPSSDIDEFPATTRGTQQSRDRFARFSARSISEDETSMSDYHSEATRSSPRHIFGFAEDDLVSFLTPERTWHKRKFELSINDLTFVGRPVFVRQNGIWAKRRKSRKISKKMDDTPEVEAISESDAEEAEDADLPEVEEQSDFRLQSTKSQLTMFHVVFVMDPLPLEHHTKVKDMYDHIVKKFSRALRWEQIHHDYVWKQSEIISAIKARMSSKRTTKTQMHAEISAQSSLAMAIATTFDAVSNFRMASVKLSPKTLVSLQIPPVTSTSYLPSLTDPPVQPGLWLTTATDIGEALSDNDLTTSNSIELAKHYTLLLKAPPHRIAKDAQEAGGSLAQHLLRFLNILRPTKSFYKLSVSSQIPLRDVQFLAQHLIDWRRAIAIPPLHQLDTYIVSPNADMTKLRDATRSYGSLFPASMLSLPKILSQLSGIPRPFASLIPSSDHKEKYYLALAYLMRNGWVTQLRTFAYIRVGPDIKRQVFEADRDSRFRSSQRYLSRETSNEGRDMGRSSTTRPRLVSNPSSDGRRSLDGNRTPSNRKMSSLILNPPRASTEESKWLDHISNTFLLDGEHSQELKDEDIVDLQKYWPAFIKYFNGRIALETIPIRETLKRKFVWQLLAKLGPSRMRDTDTEGGSSRQLLLMVRHW